MSAPATATARPAPEAREPVPRTARTAAPRAAPSPGLRLVADPARRAHRGGRVLVGGVPRRSLRLSDAGAAAVADLEAGRATGPAAAALGRRLLDAGLAHPLPAPRPVTAAETTTIVPVRDRTEELDRCLAAVRRAGDGPVLVVCDGSREPDAVAAVAARHGAERIALAASGGPAAARNAALPHVRTPLVAFVDSDCEVPEDWLARLGGHLRDPLVAAVAPRVLPRATARPTVLERHLRGCSSLDMGDRPRAVRPGGDVAYVPTAALLVRAAALGAGFDPALRFGEDVDLLWRLHDAGWRARYVPEVVVRHDEATSWRSVLGRRHRYGTSAGPLAARHGGRLAPAILAPWPTVVAGALLAGRPRTAAALAAVPVARTARRLHRAGVPARLAPAWTARGVGHAIEEVGRLSATFAPLAVAAAAAVPPLRRPLGRATVAALLAGWVRDGATLDPARGVACRLVDHAAYGSGVLRGAVAGRSARALVPRRRAVDARP